MVLILSFDVGIVNLAYCIFNTTTLKIVKWEIIKLENIKDKDNSLALPQYSPELIKPRDSQ